MSPGSNAFFSSFLGEKLVFLRIFEFWRLRFYQKQKSLGLLESSFSALFNDIQHLAVRLKIIMLSDFRNGRGV